MCIDKGERWKIRCLSEDGRYYWDVYEKHWQEKDRQIKSMWMDKKVFAEEDQVPEGAEFILFKIAKLEITDRTAKPETTERIVAPPIFFYQKPMVIKPIQY